MPVAVPEDPTQEIRKLRHQLEVKSVEPPEPELDEQELAEREAAAQAYAGEDEVHFVRFLDDCVHQSVSAMREIRRKQKECWDVYQEEEPAGYALKESWQSRVVVPKPFSSVQFFLAIVRKAFQPQFLSIENEQDKEAADFWRETMNLMLSRTYANFPIQFIDACGMGAAVGQSMEMIPVWRPGRGLDYILVPPALIQRDPDSVGRRPQSGMYWIHQEWMDYYALKQNENQGIMVNVPNCGPGGTWGSAKDNPDLEHEEIRRRQDMLWQQSAFRTKVLTSEFWGTVLDKRGELLLPNATYTVVGNRVVRLPKQSPYPTLRWPGTGFSALPHLLRFDGRSLLQGIISLWSMMCNLLALHVDNLNWTVNPPVEVDITSLIDQEDIDDYPGHLWLTHGSPNGQQVVRTVERKSNTGDVLANMNFADQRFQEGVMINYAAQGLPGWRQQVTARESAQNLEQSLTVMGLMGENIEDGALNAIVAGAETIAVNMTYKELARMGPKFAQYAENYRDDTAPTGLRLPFLTSGSFKVSGVATLMRNQEVIEALANVILPLFDGDRARIFAPYLKPYQLLQSIERRLNLRDEGIVVDEAKAQEIDQAQQGLQDAAIAQKRALDEARTMEAENLALQKGAMADKAHGEAAAKRAQALLFEEKARGAVAPEQERL
ncbi:MAG: hypothetical protein ACOC6K_04775 [Thermodesulfobacteriota bacterium]